MGQADTVCCRAARAPGPGPGQVEGGDAVGADGVADLGGTQGKPADQPQCICVAAAPGALHLESMSAAPALPLVQISLTLQPNSDPYREGNLGKCSPAWLGGHTTRERVERIVDDFLSNILVL